MTRCSVCSCILADGMLCPVCKYDSSLDYEINPTLVPVKSRTRSVSGIIKERKKIIDQRFNDELDAEKNKCAVLETRIAQMQRTNAEAVETLKEALRAKEAEIKKLKQNTQIKSLPKSTPNEVIQIPNNSNQTQYSSFGRVCDEEKNEKSPIVAIAAGREHTVVIRENGTVSACGLDYRDGRCDTKDIFNIKAIDAGTSHSVYLRKDGTVVAKGSNSFGECNVNEWHDIVAVAAGHLLTIGVRANGTIVTTGLKSYGFGARSSWNDIIAVSASKTHVAGLRRNGTAIQAGSVSSRILAGDDIVAVAAGVGETIYLLKNGNVRSTTQTGVIWKGIKAIAAGNDFIAGLTIGGKVVVRGANPNIINADINKNYEYLDWSHILAISAGEDCLLGVTSNGMIRAVGRNEAVLNTRLNQ